MKKVYIIAEAGVNHNGKLDLAYKLIDIAKNAGADAVKFQTFIAEKGISKYAEMATYQTKNLNKKVSQLEMVKDFELSFGDFTKIQKHCDDVGIQFLSTPFDFESVEFLEDLVEIYKIGSGEIINKPFLEHIAKKRKPIILSTGMSDIGEVEDAIDIISNNSKNEKSEFPDLTLLHCTTNYPCPYNEVNLEAMKTLACTFKLPVGYSDHTLGIEVPIAAVAMGATIIEKHFTIDKNLKGPDHKASLEPNELKYMVDSIRNIEQSLGNGIKKPNKSEFKIQEVARKSIVAKKDIKKGEYLTKNNITLKRPGIGISPMKWNEVLGRKAIRNFKEDELIEI